MVGWYLAIKKGDDTMATRQYIGARYVPEFYDYNGSANWRSGVEYEALTIVTVNGNSYTSKKPVPSSVGSPENNPEYWVATGLYNQQVEAYRQLTLAVADRVTDVEGDVTTLETDVSGLGTRLTTAEGDIDALETATSGLGTRLTTAEGDIDALEANIYSNKKPIGMKNCVIIGDSYGSPSRESEWSTPLINLLGLTQNEYARYCYGGSGFARDAGGYTFTGLLTLAYNDTSQDFRDNVTHIIVCGGANDTLVSQSAVQNAISDFCDTANTYFPNAKVYIGFIGCTQDSSDIASYAETSNSYHNSGGDYVYLTNVDFVLRDRSLLIANDVHPNANGANELARNIWDALMCGCCDIYKYHKRYTYTDYLSSQANIDEVLNNGLYILKYGYRSFIELGTATEMSSFGSIELMTLPTGFAVGDASAMCETTVGAVLYSSDLQTKLYLSGGIFLYNNKLWFRYLMKTNETFTVKYINIPPFTISAPSLNV